MTIFETAKNNIIKNNLIKKNQNIILGVSGGPDSIFMLHLINSIKDDFNLKLSVCHLNHGIRKEAKYDQELVSQYCSLHNLDFYLKEVNINQVIKETKRSLEDEGRFQRYNFFKEIYDLKNANCLMIAHNRSDNIETIMLNIIRGCGISGLCGLEQNSKLNNMNIIRPILTLEKSDIIKYLNDNNIKYAIDKTNFENIYSRNKLRNIIIPEINKINNNFSKQVEKLSDIAKEETKYIENQVFNIYNKIKFEENENEILLNNKIFRTLDNLIQKKLILYCIKKLMGSTKDIEKVHIEDIIVMLNKNIGNKYLMPNKHLKIFLNNNIITISKNKKL